MAYRAYDGHQFGNQGLVAKLATCHHCISEDAHKLEEQQFIPTASAIDFLNAKPHQVLFQFDKWRI
jgi:hypothetical protein